MTNLTSAFPLIPELSTLETEERYLVEIKGDMVNSSYDTQIMQLLI